jgi:hypothetical protein
MNLNDLMKFRYLVVLALVLASVSVGFGQKAKAKAKVKAADPSAIIKQLYADQKADKGPFFQLKNRAIVDKYFTKDLGDLIWAYTEDDKAALPPLGFHPMYGIEDPEGITDFVIQDTGWGGDAKFGPANEAVVQVSFKKDGKEYMTSYRFHEYKNKQWKIYDVRYIDWTTGVTEKFLKEQLSRKPEGSTTVALFEGKYQVGTAVCTVKPVKMAYEVKWHKGTGVEMFFSQGRANDKVIFSSDPPKGKASSFAFDDETFDTGTFYRADGKEMPIKRIK